METQTQVTIHFSHILWCFKKNLFIDAVGKDLREHVNHILPSTTRDIEAKKSFPKFNKLDGPTRWEGVFFIFNC